MKRVPVGPRRVAAQQLGGGAHRTPAEVVRALVAVQAQDPLGARWGIGVRLPGSTEAEIVRALDDGAILRTHLFRCTWQLFTPTDLAALLPHFGPRVVQSIRGRLKQLELPLPVITKAEKALQRALEPVAEGLERHELAEALRAAKIAPDGQRLAHLLTVAELDGLIVSGPLRDGKATWVLGERRFSTPRASPFDEVVLELARRFIETRGPVSAEDFAWWAGVKRSEARAAFAEVMPVAETFTEGGRTFLSLGTRADEGLHVLPPFDEFLISYNFRDQVLDPAHVRRINAGGGLLAPVIVHHGRVIGSWRRTLERKCVTIEIDFFVPVSKRLRAQVDEAFADYGRFLGRPIEFG